MGPNGAMLDTDGKLTSIGSWYLGGAATNNIPSMASKFLFVGKDVWLVVAIVVVVNLVMAYVQF